MNRFLLLTPKDKFAHFKITAANLNISPELVEKDFWVCWILNILFSLPGIGSHLTFKGGTSLSKCYDVIKRFSEDVDISIERRFLLDSKSIEPDTGQSNTENQKRLNQLQELCKQKVDEDILPGLRQAIISALPVAEKWDLKLDSKDPDGQTILFVYPQVIENNAESYVKSFVRLEFGARSDHWPVETLPIVPYISYFSKDLAIKEVLLRVLAAERTFWEKATILHMIYHYPSGKNMSLRMSRHYYDICAMADSPIYQRALNSILLLKHVADHKALFFKASWAHYEEATPSHLRIVPRKDQINDLANDYRQMRPMFFEEPPTFKQIIERLHGLEKEINRIKQ